DPRPLKVVGAHCLEVELVAASEYFAWNAGAERGIARIGSKESPPARTTPVVFRQGRTFISGVSGISGRKILHLDAGLRWPDRSTLVILGVARWGFRHDLRATARGV